jgi:hypothetical protein
LSAPLSVNGQLSLLADDGTELKILADGASIFVAVPSLGALRRLLRQPGWGSRRARGKGLERVAAAMSARGLVPKLSVNDLVVAELTQSIRPGLVARWLNLGPVKLHWPAILRVVLRAR